MLLNLLLQAWICFRNDFWKCGISELLTDVCVVSDEFNLGAFKMRVNKY